MTSFDDTPGLLSMTAAITGETSFINMAAWESKEAVEAVAEKFKQLWQMQHLSWPHHR